MLPFFLYTTGKIHTENYQQKTKIPNIDINKCCKKVYCSNEILHIQPLLISDEASLFNFFLELDLCCLNYWIIHLESCWIIHLESC